MGKVSCLLFVLLNCLLCSAQTGFSDAFSDGDLTSNPAWTGEPSLFIVNTSNQLQLNNTGASGSNNISYLVTNSSLSANAAWEFYIKLDFDPSTSNFAEVYLMSDQQDISQALKGYYVKIGGATGTVDDVSLYRKDSITRVQIIDGIDGTASNTPELRIKVTKNSANLWELSVDQTATGNSYVSNGTVIDSTYQSSSFFGVLCDYTSTRSDLFFFDDFVVGSSTFVDTVPPVITSVDSIGNDFILLAFNEIVDVSSSENSANYLLNPGMVNPASASISNNDGTQVRIDFSNAFVNGTSYQLITSGVRDTALNEMQVDTSDFFFFIPDTAIKRDLVINEFFPDPRPQVGLPEEEFIELYNTSSKTFDLANWSISDESSSATLPSFIFRPGEYLILCSNSTVSSFQPFGAVLGVSSFPSLNNTGDAIILRDNLNQIIDELAYDLNWYNDVNKEDGGYTLEQINPFTNCIGSANFSASNNSSGGTPGQQNSIFDTLPDLTSPELLGANVLSSDSILLLFNEFLDSNSVLNASYTFNTSASIGQVLNQAPGYQSVLLILNNPLDSGIVNTITVNQLADCSGNLIGSQNFVDIVLPAIPSYRDVVINELFPDFSPKIGLPEAEFVELFNASDKIFNLNGWILGDPSSSAVLESFIFRPGDYLIICSESNEAAFQTFGPTLGSAIFPSLNNSSDVISLRNNRGLLIDQVNYTDRWYNDDNKVSGGYTLEQINPFTDCIGSTNFSASNNSSGGTPGQQNSIFDTLPDITPPELLGATVLSSDSILLLFNEFLDSNSVLSASYAFSTSVNISQVQNQFPDYQSVLLILNNPLDSGVVNTITVNNLSDCAGNLIGSINTVDIVVPGIPEYRDVVINEFFPDFTPSIGLPEAEFIELYNASNKILDLNGWSLGDASTNSILSTQIFRPGDYLIICQKGNVEAFQNFGPTQGNDVLASLNNTEDEIFLRDNTDKLIDFISYTDNWYRDETKKGGGYTLEQINPFLPCTGNLNFIASVSNTGGTPGQTNSVFDNMPDIDAPELLNTFVVSKDTLLLVFNEGLDTSSVLSGDYVFSNGNTVSQIINLAPSFNSVQLILTNSLIPGEVITLNISNISDCSGNSTAPNTSSSIALPEEAMKNDIVINEILFNPISSSNDDFVELYNRSDKVLSLKNWAMGNADDPVVNKKTITANAYILFPGEYIVLTENPSQIIADYPLSRADRFIEVDDLPTYSNDNGEVYLIDENDLIIDFVPYSDDQHFPLLDDDKGVSLERISPERASDDFDNFHSASERVGFATPGYQNSQFFAETRFSGKITIDPETFSPDNDGFQDVVNINYQFDAPGFLANVDIFDRNGRKIKQLVNNELLGSKGTFTWDGTTDDNTKARIGIYLILVEALNPNGNKETFKEVVVVAGFLD